MSGLAVAIAAALAASGSVGAGELQRLPSLRISDAVRELAQPSSRSGVAVSRPAERQPTVAGTAAVPKSDDPAVLFHEDFQSYSSVQPYPVPAPPMMVVNQDGLVPHPSVSYVTDAWVVRPDWREPGNLAAASTSYYVPAGIADDWLILPAVPVTGNTRLSWRGMSVDQLYRERYRVWVSPSGGSALADFTSVVADTGPDGEEPAWNARSVWLSPFAGQTVRVAFQNYSTDQYLGYVDDILIENVPDFDAALAETVLLPPYTRVPTFLEYAAPVTLYVANSGVQAITGAQLSVEILADGEAVDTQVLPAIASVASDATQAVAMSLPVLAEAQYALAASVAIDETDQRPGNDSRLFDDVVIGTAATLARDDGEATTYVLIGVGSGGELGQEFEVDRTVEVLGATFAMGVYPVETGLPDLRGETLRVRLRGWNETASIPDLTIAEAAVVVPVDLEPDEAVWLDAAFPAGTLAPAGGRFVITVEALADRQALVVLQTDGRYVPRTTWVLSDAVLGGNWTAVSDMSASLGKPMQIRAVLGAPQPHAIDDSFTTVVGQALSDNVAANDIPSPMGGNTWSTVMLPNYGNLTMNADGSFIYTPLAGFDGPDYFTYRVCDSQSRCDVGDVAIMVRELDVFRDGFESP